jgi:hypothetical protein
MKITRRSDNGKSGHLLISVPASRVAEVEAALAFLEAPAAWVASNHRLGRAGRAAQWMAAGTA